MMHIYKVLNKGFIVERLTDNYCDSIKDNSKVFISRRPHILSTDLTLVYFHTNTKPFYFNCSSLFKNKSSVPLFITQTLKKKKRRTKKTVLRGRILEV